MKEFLFQIKKMAIASLKFQERRIRRLFVKTTLDYESSFLVPIVINNRNRYTYLKDFVNWLQKAGYQNIYILDNDSDYSKLTEYYKETSAKIIFLKKNLGYKALWQTNFFETIKSSFYVYTDADLIPVENCPQDLIFNLYKILSKHTAEKCGPALKIDDLPDHYSLKEKVLNNEKPFWNKEIGKEIYDAPIDTTFALYKPFAFGDAEECKALRVGGKYTFIHRPWYENSSQLDEETKYYIKHASTSSFWYNKVKSLS